jgi:hypothetical protein
MMPDLEQIDLSDPSLQYRLGGLAGVSHEDGAKAAVTHEQYHGIVVEIDPPPGPGGIGMQDREADAIDRELVAAAGWIPRRP